MARDPDPIVLYVVVRRSLNLSGGKAAAQVGHAVHYLCRWMFSGTESSERRDTARAWDRSDEHAKITLGASEDEFAKVIAENSENFPVIDLGFTQVAPNTQTAVGLYPMRKSQSSETVKTLRPL